MTIRDLITECILAAKPTALVGVPVLFSKLHDGIKSKIAAKPKLVRMLFAWALSVSRQRNHNLEFGLPVSPFLEWKFQLVDKILFSKIRQGLGGNLR